MHTFNSQSRSKYLTIVLIFLCVLFITSLFKNISYPLFWSDESMTVMGGVRVLQYGYPKVHDGKNVLYDLLHPNTSLGIDKKTDAYIGGANWGQYYFATLGIKLAEMSGDLFTKTAIIRVTFALMGLAGLAILAFLASQFFHTRLSKTGFLTLFVFFEVISVPLALHLREARYYPLTVLFVSLTILIYARYHMLKNIRYPTYLTLLAVTLFLLFFTFSPAYFVFLFSVFLFESTLLVKHLFFRYGKKHQITPAKTLSQKGTFKGYLKCMLPLVLSLIAVYPLTVFFRTFYIAEEMTRYNVQLFGTDRTGMFLANLEVIWTFFSSSDNIYLAILLKSCLLFCFFLTAMGKHITTVDWPKVVFSNFLTVFFIVYCVSIGKIPNFLFTRYFIPLQPILALIIILDLATLYNFISQYRSSAMTYAKAFLAIIVAGFITVNISHNSHYLKGHLFEVFNQYRGPLDYVVPFIKERYPNTDDLVIATNYEETSFMYYLKTKVTVGYVGNNLAEDLRTTPDIIVYRKLWPMFASIFDNFLQQHAYERISFPVVDYSVNNIPELNWRPPFHHRFRTQETLDEREKVDIYVRK